MKFLTKCSDGDAVTGGIGNYGAFVAVAAADHGEIH